STSLNRILPPFAFTVMDYILITPISLHDALPIYPFTDVIDLHKATVTNGQRRPTVLVSVNLDTEKGRKGTLLGLFASEKAEQGADRKSTRLNSSHVANSYAVFCLKKEKQAQSRKS